MGAAAVGWRPGPRRARRCRGRGRGGRRRRRSRRGGATWVGADGNGGNVGADIGVLLPANAREDRCVDDWLTPFRGDGRDGSQSMRKRRTKRDDRRGRQPAVPADDGGRRMGCSSRPDVLIEAEDVHRGHRRVLQRHLIGRTSPGHRRLSNPVVSLVPEEVDVDSRPVRTARALRPEPRRPASRRALWRRMAGCLRPRS